MVTALHRELLSVTLSRLLSLPSDPASILVRDADISNGFDITPPAEVAAQLNRLFPFDSATTQFATMVYGVLNVASGEFRYVSAGHPGPVHLPYVSEPVILESPGSPIGLADDSYESAQFASRRETDFISIPMVFPRRWTPMGKPLAMRCSWRRLEKGVPNYSTTASQHLRSQSLSGGDQKNRKTISPFLPSSFPSQRK